jgi:addiction module HigA family antidote
MGIVADILADKKEELNLTQQELAEAIGTSRATIHRILREKKGVSAEMALRIGKAIGEKPSHLFVGQAQERLRQAKENVDLSDVTPVA